MKASWALQDAKNRFSEVVNRSLHKGPQIVTRYGVPVVVVMAVNDYQKHRRDKGSLVQFFQQSPLRGVELDIARDKGTGRKVTL